MTAASPGQPPTGHSARDAFAAALLLSAAVLAQDVRAQGRAAQVAVRNVAFTPAQLTVDIGDSVSWPNADIVAHTATSNEGEFDVSVPPSGNASAVMTRPGTFGSICRYHPTMKGQGVVTPQPRAARAESIARDDLLDGGAVQAPPREWPLPLERKALQTVQTQVIEACHPVVPGCADS